MGLRKAALWELIQDFNRRGERPHGKLLTLSKYHIRVDASAFNHLCRAGGWDGSAIADGIDKDGFLNDETAFRLLGFESVDSMDCSGYEGANIIHNLNDANLPEELIGRYDFILDAGTIEHVFHFQNVLENVFKMLRVGGTFYFDLPVFWMPNHGYYDFSPCLLNDYFKANHYTINHLILSTEIDGFVYTADSVVNDIFGHQIPLMPNSGNTIWGSVTKTPETRFDAIPQQGQYSEKWGPDYYQTIADTIDSADEGALYLYGTGHFFAIYSNCCPIATEIKSRGFSARIRGKSARAFTDIKSVRLMK